MRSQGGKGRTFKADTRRAARLSTTQAGRMRLTAQRQATRAAMSGRFQQTILNKETGFVDLAVANYACDTTGTITLLATVPQGASVNQRVGKKAVWKSIQTKGQVSAGSTAVTPEGTAIIVYDKRPTGSLPAITDVLVTANSRSFNNDANAGRFKIVRRFDWNLIGNTTSPATGMEAFQFDEYIKMNEMPVVFKAAGTGAINDIEEGALYLITVGSAAAGTQAATLTAGFRVRFYDV